MSVYRTHFAVGLCALALGGTTFAGGPAIGFVEDFDNDSAFWFNSPANMPADWSPTGSVDGGAYITETFDFSNSAFEDTPVFFRAQDEFGSSGGAFEGDYIAGGVTGLTYQFRHNAPVPLTPFARFSSPLNFPGAIGIQFAPVLPGEWSKVFIPINEFAPNFVSFEGSDFNTIFSDIGHLQLGISVPAALEGSPLSVVFDVDKVQLVPTPGVGALLAFGALAAGRRRRR